MKVLLPILSVLLIFSCSKERITIHDLSGLYMDSLTYVKYGDYGGMTRVDTVVLKKIYKVNDTTFKIGPNHNLDTNETTVQTHLRFRIKFILRTDNSIIIDHEGFPYSHAIGYYDPVQQVIHNLYRIDITNPYLYEKHTLRRIDH